MKTWRQEGIPPLRGSVARDSGPADGGYPARCARVLRTAVSCGRQ
jgi:hypothetical protein